MLISLGSLAKTLNVSTQTILNHYKKCVKTHQISSNDSVKKQHIRFFNKKAVKQIEKSFPNRVSIPNKNTLMTKLEDQEKFNNYLKEDNLLKTNHISKLSKLLDQQQQLQLATKKENDKLSNENEHLKSIPGTLQKSHNNTNKPKKKGFWQRLFNR